jgi:hypothetical protein
MALRARSLGIGCVDERRQVPGGRGHRRGAAGLRGGVGRGMAATAALQGVGAMRGILGGGRAVGGLVQGVVPGRRVGFERGQGTRKAIRAARLGELCAAVAGAGFRGIGLTDRSPLWVGILDRRTHGRQWTQARPVPGRNSDWTFRAWAPQNWAQIKHSAS